MKRVNEYKKLYNAEVDVTLKELKTTYRTLVKEWHPDKFQNEEEKIRGGSEKSKNYRWVSFLISIANETKEANLEEYKVTTTESGISDFKHKGLLLEVSFQDGTTYEYFGVNKNLFQKLVNSDKQFRFAKRNIFNSFLYRKSKKDLQPA